MLVYSKPSGKLELNKCESHHSVGHTNVYYYYEILNVYVFKFDQTVDQFEIIGIGTQASNQYYTFRVCTPSDQP